MTAHSPRTVRVLVAFVALLASACGSDPEVTSVRVHLEYDDAWQLDRLDLAFGDIDVSTAATRQVFARLPDDWIDRPMTIDVLGLRGATRVAAATAVVTPVLDSEVPVRVWLARLPCGAWCAAGSTTCIGDGVSVCLERDDECMEWGPPEPCAASCSLGTCVAQCVDECVVGETRCDGPLAIAVCGNADGDSCRDWMPSSACDDGTTCSNGACRAVCADECAAGATRCDGPGVSTCGDRDFDGCLQWGPTVNCTGGATCSAGECSTTCTDECSASTCVDVSVRSCGQFDLDACRDLSPGKSCVPEDPCREGTCEMGACRSVEMPCDDPPDATCLGADILRSYEPRGVCAAGVCEYTVRDTACPTGCADGACNFPSSNADVLGTWAPTGVSAVIANGTVFNTSTDCADPSILGKCFVVTQAVGPEICACRVDDLTVHGLSVLGTRALAILAWNDVTVDGLLRMAPGTGIGATVSGQPRLNDGGTYGTQGGTHLATQVPVWGDPRIVPLRGGMSSTGSGGGALQISARHAIVVTGTVSAPGAGGAFAANAGAGNGIGGGGGSGGSLLLEAPSVRITGTAAANGGSGGGGQLLLHDPDANEVMGTSGFEGRAGLVAAPGGAGSTASFTGGCGFAQAGRGGAGSAGNGAGAKGEVPTAPCNLVETAGGCGGGAGRIRVNASTPCDCPGTFSPTPTFGAP